MATYSSRAFSFEAFVGQVKCLRAAMLTPAGRGRLRQAGLGSETLLARVDTVQRIGQAMTAAERADPAMLTVADRERVARGSGTSVVEVDDPLARYRRATEDPDA